MCGKEFPKSPMSPETPRTPKRSRDEDEEAVNTNAAVESRPTSPSKRRRINSGNDDNKDYKDALKDAVKDAMKYAIEDCADTTSTHLSNNPSDDDNLLDFEDLFNYEAFFDCEDLSNDEGLANDEDVTDDGYLSDDDTLSDDSDLSNIEVGLDDLESIPDDEVEIMYRSLTPMDFTSDDENLYPGLSPINFMEEDYFSDSVSMTTTLAALIDEVGNEELIGRELDAVELSLSDNSSQHQVPRRVLPPSATVSGREYLRYVNAGGDISEPDEPFDDEKPSDDED
ncbi:hypothetical protein EDB81DRAFT_874396 [Dactylonectria macrodidyma]|uniref:Uncharacterized protein n=1 Tax=Dactylonectria macrodidyma TaxID=307937 RepID=A0A9P9FTZ6_9HYPO|nr:hypothetical protein EDB81DRAFT_874396 [Dactylonectria macrodidyma]